MDSFPRESATCAAIVAPGRGARISCKLQQTQKGLLLRSDVIDAPYDRQLRRARCRKWRSPMDYLDREQQLFVRQQMCNWVLGLDRRFIEMNRAWSPLGAQAYFWS